MTRSKGASSYQEAERVKSVETSVICRGTVPDVKLPTSTAELNSNRREFQTAISNALKGAHYGCAKLISLLSFPGCAGASDHISQEMRLKLRFLMDHNDAKRAGQQYQELHANVAKYILLHIVARHYSFQLGRGWCEAELGRRCIAADYPFPEQLTFQPCCSFVPASGNVPWATPPVIAQPPLDPDRPGHRMPPEIARAAVEQ